MCQNLNRRRDFYRVRQVARLYGCRQHGFDKILVEIDPPPVNIVYPQGRLVPQKVRAFVDFAMPRLRECLALIETDCSV